MVWSHSTRLSCSRVGPSRLSHTSERLQGGTLEAGSLARSARQRFDSLVLFSVRQARAAYRPERPTHIRSMSPEQAASTLAGDEPGGSTLPPWVTGARPPVSG